MSKNPILSMVQDASTPKQSKLGIAKVSERRRQS